MSDAILGGPPASAAATAPREPANTLRVNEAFFFQRLRWGLLRNSLRLLLAQSLVRVLTIVLCCLLIWGVLFTVSYLGFRELVEVHQVDIDMKLFVLIFNLSFITLSVLLIFSTGIILYGSLFRAQESAFLLTTPLRADQIFAYKYQGALGFSSWAFVLLGSPVLLAYGLTIRHGAPWYYFLFLPVFFLGFILLPGSIGALVCLLLVNFFPRRKKQVLIGLAGLGAALLGWWIYTRLLPSARGALISVEPIFEFLGEFSLFQNPFLPTQWMAQGLRDAAVGKWESALYYLTLIWSNGLLLYVATTWAAHKLYRRGYNLLASDGGARRRYRTILLDRLLTGLFWWVERPTRVLIGKDFRTFRRDPVQWGQLLIFLGLVVMIFGMMRWLYLQSISQRFQNGVGLLFLTATSFLLCAYTGRFIFPMLSLEGRKFWVLGLLPLKRSDLLRSKFAFSAVMTVGAGELLVLFSHVMLGLSWTFVVLHAAAIAILAVGLSGLSAGMGAALPNFRETDPSKIAVGFGGTLTLVLGFLYQLVVLAVMVLPWHITAALQGSEEFHNSGHFGWLLAGVALGLGLGVLTAVLALRAGTRALEKMEF